MTKIEIITIASIILISVVGLFVTGFWGGFLTGAGTTMLFLVIVGKWVFRKAVRRMSRNRHQRVKEAG